MSSIFNSIRVGTMSKINVNQIKGDWKYMVEEILLGKGMISEN